MQLSDFIKPIKVPTQFEVPKTLTYQHLKATLLNRKDAKEDLFAVNSSLDLIRKTRGGSWPEEELSEEYNDLDLAWHERENRDGTSFAYSIRDAQGEYIGCIYLYPLGQRQELSQELLAYDFDASWWTTNIAYSRGDYAVLYNGLRTWLDQEFHGFGKPWYSNIVIP